MNQWPGVRLRVTEGWDEEGHHASDSLHYEGRAVDVTTSDRDRSKYGMLARLAVEAGFDWVYYESRAHIHCSVKSESSEAAKYGGCFAGDSIVQTSTGKKRKLSELQIGEQILAMDTSTKQLVYSEVLMFLDWDPFHHRDFVKLDLDSGRTLTVTPSHLVVTGTAHFSKIVFADTLNVGNTLLVYSANGNQFADSVVKVTRVHRTGVYAPLTSAGTVIVNDILVSCYAIVDSHDLAHGVFYPVRIMISVRNSFYRLYKTIKFPSMDWLISSTEPKLIQKSNPPRGVHWYAKMLYYISQYIIPWQILHK